MAAGAHNPGFPLSADLLQGAAIMSGSQYIELSHRMIPGKEPFKLEVSVKDVTELIPDVKHRADIWYVVGEVSMLVHAGTHIEFPFHHWQTGADAADFPLDRLIGEGVVLDFSHKQAGEAITLAELQAQAGRVCKGDIIFIRTDKDALYRTPDWNDQPYFTNEAIEWLVTTYEPKVIGTDSAGFEVPGTDYQPNHLSMFSRNIAMVESATNLAAVGDRRVKVYILPLPIEGVEASPVRIIAEPL
jgi:arylformamidase